MLNPQQGLGCGVINGKRLLTGLATIAVSLTSFAELNGFNTAAVGTMAVVFFLALLLSILSLDC